MICQAKPPFLKILHPEAFSTLGPLNHEPVVSSTHRGLTSHGLGELRRPPPPNRRPVPIVQQLATSVSAIHDADCGFSAPCDFISK